MLSKNKYIKYLQHLGALHLIVCSWIPFIYLADWKEHLGNGTSIFQYIFFALVLISVLISTLSAMWVFNAIGTFNKKL